MKGVRGKIEIGKTIEKGLDIGNNGIELGSNYFYLTN